MHGINACVSDNTRTWPAPTPISVVSDVTGSPNSTTGETYNVFGTGRYVKFEFTSNSGASDRRALGEVRFIGRAAGVSPVSNSVATAFTSTSAMLNATLACPNGMYSVYACWSTNNYGPVAEAWTNRAYVGSWTNIASTNISYKAAGLKKNTTYYFTFCASNACGMLWPANVLSFMTAGPPTVNNANGAKPIGIGHATLNGNFAMGGTGSVCICWGSSDGGTATSAWNHVVALCVMTTPSSFSTTVSNLLYGLTYYYRAFVTNSFGGAWAPNRASFTTWSPGGVDDNPTFTSYDATGVTDVSRQGTSIRAYTSDKSLETVNGVAFAPISCGRDANTRISDASGASTWGGGIAWPGTVNFTVCGMWNRPAISFSGLTTNIGYQYQLFCSISHVSMKPYGNRDFDLNLSLGGGGSVRTGTVRQNHLNDAYSDSQTVSTVTFCSGTNTTTAFSIGVLNNAPIINAFQLRAGIGSPNPISNMFATNILSTSADLKATLNATGALYRACAFWGTTDGGTTGANWANTHWFGWYTNTTVSLTKSVSNLTANTKYYVTFLATNCCTNEWATSSANFTTAAVAGPSGGAE